MMGSTLPSDVRAQIHEQLGIVALDQAGASLASERRGINLAGRYADSNAFRDPELRTLVEVLDTVNRVYPDGATRAETVAAVEELAGPAALERLEWIWQVGGDPWEEAASMSPQSAMARFESAYADLLMTHILRRIGLLSLVLDDPDRDPALDVQLRELLALSLAYERAFPGVRQRAQAALQREANLPPRAILTK